MLLMWAIEATAFVVFAALMITQVLAPLLMAGPLFPLFRKLFQRDVVAAAEDELHDAENDLTASKIRRDARRLREEIRHESERP